MNEAFECGCGNDKFWFFIDHVRCTKCFTEYKEVKGVVFAALYRAESKTNYLPWKEYK